jgi:hypothetical protein
MATLTGIASMEKRSMNSPQEIHRFDKRRLSKKEEE